MRILGYSLTWPTSCFISGGCGQSVFAHTNGDGDFVLFDELGPPWPIHDCYLNRFILGGITSRGLYQLNSETANEYRQLEDPRRPRQIRTTRYIEKMNPENYVGRGEIPIVRYVLDYLENRAARLATEMGSVGQHQLFAALGRCRSQLTIITADFQSFTAFADMAAVVAKRKDIVTATLTAMPCLSIPGSRSVFVCKDVQLVRGITN
jgi:hypothetical protein